MLSAALRVLARSAAIQLEETATATARTATATARATTRTRTAAATAARTRSEQHGQWPNTSLAKTLDAPPGVSHEAALDRLIDAAPHEPPLPAPDTHPADKSPLTSKPEESRTVKPIDTTRKATSIVKEPEAAESIVRELEAAESIVKEPEAVEDTAVKTAKLQNGQAEPLIVPEDEEVCPVSYILVT